MVDRPPLGKTMMIFGRRQEYSFVQYFGRIDAAGFVPARAVQMVNDGISPRRMRGIAEGQIEAVTHVALHRRTAISVVGHFRRQLGHDGSNPHAVRICLPGLCGLWSLCIKGQASSREQEDAKKKSGNVVHGGFVFFAWFLSLFFRPRAEAPEADAVEWRRRLEASFREAPVFVI
jgi:hypothetical protein